MFWSLNISNFLEPEDTEKEAEAPSSHVAFLLFFFLTVHQIIQINLCIWFTEAHIWIVEWGKLSFFFFKDGDKDKNTPLKIKCLD